jgi:sporulation protein YlmC with PRC-barrel domain
MPVIAVESGERFGQVQDILIDPQERRIAIVRVRRGGPFRGDVSDVPFSDLHGIGRDAVMVPSSQVLRPATATTEHLRRIDDLVGSRVVTERGEAAGTVDDAEINPQTGAVTHLLIAPPSISGLLGRRRTVSIDQVRTIGRDAVVLAAPPSEGTQEARTANAAEAASDQ